MTALYAITALIVIFAVMAGAYMVVFGDGIMAEQLRMRKAAMLSIKEEAPAATIANHHDGEDYPQGEARHHLTHADMVQLEQQVKNKQNKKEQA